MRVNILQNFLVAMLVLVTVQTARAGETRFSVVFNSEQVKLSVFEDVGNQEYASGGGGGCFISSTGDSRNEDAVFHILEVEDENTYLEGVTGAPFLPVKTIKVLIPSGASFDELEVVDITSSLYGVYRVLPTQAVVNPDQTTDFVGPDPAYYSLNSKYPASPVEFGSEGTMRGYRVVTLKVYPLQYIPASDEVYLNEEIWVTVRWTENDPTTTDGQAPARYPYDSDFESIIKSTVINSEDVEQAAGRQSDVWTASPTAANDVKYLIITSQGLAGAFQPLADWKTQKGVPALVLSTTDIYSAYTGTDNQEKIKKAIQSYVQNQGTLWVLLGGDDTVVPDRDCYGYVSSSSGPVTDTTIPTDLYYASLDYTNWNTNGGNACETSDTLDLEYDVFVGRAPVRTTDQAAAFVNKSINYDKTPPASDFAEKMVLMGVQLWSVISGQSDAYWKSESMYGSYIDPYWGATRSLFYDTTTSFAGGADYTVNSTNVSAQFNAGYNFAFMATHGNWNIWSMESGYFYNSNALALTNGQKQGHVYTMACITAKFDGTSDPCLAEGFLRNPNGGAVSYIGSSRYGWGYAYTTSHGPSFQYADNFYRILFTGQPAGYANHLGAIFSAHKQALAGSSAVYGATRWLQFSLNLLGDPELYVHTGNPQTFNVDHVGQVLVGSQNFLVETGVAQALVCLSKGSEVYAYGPADGLGVFSATINPQSSGNLTVTVSAPNYQAYQAEVPVMTIPGPPVIVDIQDASVYNNATYTGPLPFLSQGTLPVTWSLISGPFGMTINAGTGRVNWVNPLIDGSPYTITIRAENEEGQTDETWRLTVTTPPSNLALYKTATQSTTGWGGTADRAVDGNTSGDWSVGSVMSTGPESETNPWWQVDLGERYQVNELVLYKRTDCCGSNLSNFYVLVSDNPFQSNNLATVLAQDGVWSYLHAGEADQGDTIIVGKAGRYVRLQKNAVGFIQMAEAEIWGVNAPPEAPVVNAISDASVAENQSYSGPTPVLSQGTLPVSWSLTSGPSGMTINPVTGVVSWSPASSAGSPYTVTIRAANSVGQDETSWQLTVIPPDPPVIEPIGQASVYTGNGYTGPTPVLSQGTVPITWSLAGGPSGMTINAGTGVVSWSMPTLAGSPHTITIRAENSAGFDETSWSLTVADAPYVPENIGLRKTAVQSTTGWGGVASRAVDGNTNGNWSNSSVISTGPDSEKEPWWQVDLGQVYHLDDITLYKRTDCCGSHLSNFYILVSEVPFQSTDLNTTLAQQGVWSYFHQGEADQPDLISIGRNGRYLRIQKIGTGWLQMAEAIIMGGEAAPTAPVLQAMSNASVQEGLTYTGQTPGLSQGSSPLVWSLLAGPAGMTINPSTGVVNWVSASAAGSPHTITIKAQNSAGSDSVSWQLAVTEAPPALAPVINDVSNASVGEGASYTGPVPSLSQGTLPVTWSLTAGPSGMTIDAGTGKVAWAGAALAGSPHQITVKAQNMAGYDEVSWLLTVNEAQVDPVNLALRKTATQSTTGWGGVAPRAVDGNTNGNWSNNSVISTGPSEEYQPWWLVDLGQVYQIDRITLYKRTDCCGNHLSDFYILVSDVPFQSTDLGTARSQAGVSEYYHQGEADQGDNITIGRTGRYVRLQKATTGWIQMAEVQIWGGTAPPKPPFINPIADGTVQEGLRYSGPVPVLSQGTLPVVWSLTGGPGDMTINSATGQVSWATAVLDGSPHTIGIRAENSAGGDEASWQLTVTEAPPQTPPVIDPMANDTATEGINYTGKTPSLSEGTLPVTWILAAGPSGMTINQETGVVSWAWPTVTGSPHTISVGAENSAGYDQVSFQLTVTESVSEPVNVALNKTASQSSVGWGGAAPRAVDGNTNGNWSIGSVMSTGPSEELEPWWSVDLGEVFNINQVKLFKRTDCCGTHLANFYILVSEDPFNSTDLTTTLSQDGVWSYFHAGVADQPDSIPVGATGRYVRIQKLGTGWLQMAEAEVWGGAAAPEPPILESIPDASVQEGHIYSGPTPTLTQGTQPIVWSLISGPAGLTINPDTGVVSWSNPAVTGSPHAITIRADNAAGSDETGWELTVIDAPEEPMNLALNKTVAQSSTGWGGVASRAVDGNTSGNWSNGSVMSTGPDSELDPWWSVDLGGVYQIEEVVLYIRTDCCSGNLSNFYVLISDVPFQSTDLDSTLAQPGVWSEYHAGQPDLPGTITVGRTGRYVRIQRNGTGWIQMAEAQVWGLP